MGRLRKLKELHVRNNAIKYFPASIQKLKLYTFTGTYVHMKKWGSHYSRYLFYAAQNNSLIQESVARELFKFPSESIPPLLELAARAVVKWELPITPGSIPQHLEGTLTILHNGLHTIVVCNTLQILWLADFALRVVVASKFCFIMSIIPSCLIQWVLCKPLVFLTGSQYYVLSVLNSACSHHSSTSLAATGHSLHMLHWAHTHLWAHMHLWARMHLWAVCMLVYFLQSCWSHLFSAHSVENISFITILPVSHTKLLDFITDYHCMIFCVCHVIKSSAINKVLWVWMNSCLACWWQVYSTSFSTVWIVQT